jgi:hypothetical protein
MEEHAAHMPDGPEKEIFLLLLNLCRATDEKIRSNLAELDREGDSPEERERTDKLLRLEQRVEQMYLEELRLHDKDDGTVERKILDTLFHCFGMMHKPEQVREFFARHSPPKKKKAAARPSNSVRPRSFLTDKKTFVEAFLASGQTKYAFAKKVAQINAALPPGKRFGCNSTSQPDVETQLDRAIEQWGDIVRSDMSRGQK